MASLNIDFSYDDNVKRSINSAKSSLSTRINDYKGIKTNLSKVSSSTGNLSTANTYIQKKINSLQSKYDKLESFRTAVTNFNANAEAADRRVANRINTETNQFYKREGIKTGILYAIGSVIGKGAKWLKGKIEAAFTVVVTCVKSAWENVKQWYQDNKYWFDIIVDVACVVAAAVALIAAFATAGTVALVFAVVFATWGLAKSGWDLVYDIAAYGAYKDGDMELYEELSSGGLKNVMTYCFGDAGTYIYYGMEIASAIYSVYKIGSAVKTWYSSGKDFSKIIQQSTGIKWSSKDAWNTLITIKKVDIFTSDFSFLLKTFKNFLSEDNGWVATIKSIKITKIGWDLASNFDSIRKMCVADKSTVAISKTAISLAPALTVKPIVTVNCNFSLITMKGAAVAA